MRMTNPVVEHPMFIMHAIDKSGERCRAPIIGLIFNTVLRKRHVFHERTFPVGWGKTSKGGMKWKAGSRRTVIPAGVSFS